MALTRRDLLKGAAGLLAGSGPALALPRSLGDGIMPTGLEALSSRVDKLATEMGALLQNPNIRVILNDSAAVPVGNGAVDETHIADNSISTLKLQNLAVNGAKIADATITGTKIANATIQNAHIEDATIASAKIANLEANKIVAGSGIINDLTILAKLTLGAGGSIEDADGSEWNQSGINLKATDIVSDAIVISRNGFSNGSVKWGGSIDAVKVRTVLYSNWTDGVLNTRNAGIRGEATNSDATTVAGIEVVSTGGLLNEVYSYADGIITIGSLYSAGGVARLGLFRSPTFGGGEGVIYIGNRATAPTSNPTSGGLLYTENGALRYRGSSGTTTTIAVA